MGKKNKSIIKQEIDYEQLSKAITKALKSSNEEIKSEAIKESELQNQEWRDQLGQSNYHKISKAKWFFKPILYIWFDLVAIWSLCTFKHKNANSTKATIALIRLSTSAMFSIIKVILWLGIIVLLVIPLYYKNLKYLIEFIPISLVLFLIERIIRIAKMEIENTENKEIIFMTFNSLISFISVFLVAFSIVVAIKS